MYNYEKEVKNLEKFQLKLKQLTESIKKTPFKLAPYETVLLNDNSVAAYRFRTNTDNLRYFIKQYIVKGIKDFNDRNQENQIPLNENDIIVINKPFGYVDISEPLELVNKKNIIDFLRQPLKKKRVKGVYASLLLILPMSYQKNYSPKKSMGDPIFSSLDYELNSNGKGVTLYKPVEYIIRNLMYSDQDLYKGKLAISKHGNKAARLTDIFHINKNTAYKSLKRLSKPSVMRIGNQDRVVVLLDVDKVLKALVSQLNISGDIYNILATESQNKDDNGIISYKYEFTISDNPEYINKDKKNKGYGNYIKARDLNTITKLR